MVVVVFTAVWMVRGQRNHKWRRGETLNSGTFHSCFTSLPEMGVGITACVLLMIQFVYLLVQLILQLDIFIFRLYIDLSIAVPNYLQKRHNSWPTNRPLPTPTSVTDSGSLLYRYYLLSYSCLVVNYCRFWKIWCHKKGVTRNLLITINMTRFSTDFSRTGFFGTFGLVHDW